MSDFQSMEKSERGDEVVKWRRRTGHHLGSLCEFCRPGRVEGGVELRRVIRSARSTAQVSESTHLVEMNRDVDSSARPGAGKQSAFRPKVRRVNRAATGDNVRERRQARVGSRKMTSAQQRAKLTCLARHLQAASSAHKSANAGNE